MQPVFPCQLLVFVEINKVIHHIRYPEYERNRRKIAENFSITESQCVAVHALFGLSGAADDINYKHSL